MWRVEVRASIYDGARHVCECHAEEDARLIVEAVNAQLGMLKLLQGFTAEDIASIEEDIKNGRA